MSDKYGAILEGLNNRRWFESMLNTEIGFLSRHDWVFTRKEGAGYRIFYFLGGENQYTDVLTAEEAKKYLKSVRVADKVKYLDDNSGAYYEKQLKNHLDTINKNGVWYAVKSAGKDDYWDNYRDTIYVRKDPSTGMYQAWGKNKNRTKEYTGSEIQDVFTSLMDGRGKKIYKFCSDRSLQDYANAKKANDDYQERKRLDKKQGADDSTGKFTDKTSRERQIEDMNKKGSQFNSAWDLPFDTYGT